jgi:branched-chain amino acid transport system substrate-binding protein
MKEWMAWMKKYNPSGNLADASNVYGYGVAFVMAEVLRACGNEITRENVMKQATKLHIKDGPLSLPGLVVSTSPDDYAPIKQMQLMKFDGETWKLFGELISGGAGS